MRFVAVATKMYHILMNHGLKYRYGTRYPCIMQNASVYFTLLHCFFLQILPDTRVYSCGLGAFTKIQFHVHMPPRLELTICGLHKASCRNRTGTHCVAGGCPVSILLAYSIDEEDTSKLRNPS